MRFRPLRLTLALSLCAVASSCDKAPPLEAGTLPETTRTASILPRLKAETQYNLEWVGPTVEPILRRVEATADRERQLTIGGWAVDTAAREAAGAVEIVVDGRGVAAEYGLERVDVASVLNEPRYRASGFQLVLPPETLATGEHSVSVRIISADRKGYYETPAVRLTLR